MVAGDADGVAGAKTELFAVRFGIVVVKGLLRMSVLASEIENVVERLRHRRSVRVQSLHQLIRGPRHLQNSFRDA